MGQKTHPKGFRLITTQDHLSKWYTSKFDYSSLIEEDFFIRSKVDKIFSDLLSISKIEINRINQNVEKNEYIVIDIYALFPRAKEMSRKVLKYLIDNKDENVIKNLPGINGLISNKENLKDFSAFLLKRTIRQFVRFLQVKFQKNYCINLKFIRNVFEDSTLIAKFIANQLEKRTPFRRAMKQAIKKVQHTEIKGIKIQISGRLNGNDIARSEWKREGNIPLHTLKAKIDYTHQNAYTIYGIIGIKVWLFSGFEE